MCVARHLNVCPVFRDTRTNAADRAATIPTVRRVGGLRFEFKADDYPEAFRTFCAMVTIAGGE
jgi:D-aminopeptidase